MNTQNKKLCFALILSEKAIETIYHTVIIPACKEAGWQTLEIGELKSLLHNPQRLIEYLFTSIVDFSNGNCYINLMDDLNYVRAVRSKQ
jgi:hypothetical protein